MTFVLEYNTTLRSMTYVCSKILLLLKIIFLMYPLVSLQIDLLCGDRFQDLTVYVECEQKWESSRKKGNERECCKAPRRYVLSYEGNICKQVIDALERRLDKWRTVPLLFKRPRMCEWIFCSQKARPNSVQDFHSRLSRPFQILSPSIIERNEV